MSYQALPNCLHVKDSPIAGQGLFATQDKDIKKGDELFLKYTFYSV